MQTLSSQSYPCTKKIVCEQPSPKQIWYYPELKVEDEFEWKLIELFKYIA